MGVGALPPACTFARVVLLRQHATLLRHIVRMQRFCAILSACNALAPYCLHATLLRHIVCCLWIHRTFRHYVISDTILGGRGGLLNIKLVF